VRYQVPTDNKGWYFVVVSGSRAARVRNRFFQRHELSSRPWNSWYWPHDDNKNPNLYDPVVRYRYPTGGPEPGPLAKYDSHTGQTSSATSAREYEEGRYRSSSGVGGHCDAIAWAGFEETRIRGPKRAGGTSFREQDRLGLMTERYWVSTNGEVNVDEPGSSHHLFRKAGTYLDAAWFHEKLRTRIAEDVGGIIVFDTGNWNFGVFRYLANFVAHGVSDAEAKQVTIRNVMTYRHWGTTRSSPRRKWNGGPNRSFRTTYELEYADDGNISRQLSWPRASVRSGRSYTITKAYYKKPGAPILNPRLNKATLESLYR
jgi:hypothetical protein